MKINIDEIWPQERDLMIRPDRFKYVRKLIKPKACVFCEAVSQKPSLENLVIYQSKEAFVILNKYPYNNGHILILPRLHIGQLKKIEDRVFNEINWLIKKSFEILEKVFSCQGINMGMNHGEVAGAGIPDHLHWHIIPRWSGDTNFFPLISETKLLAQSIEQIYEVLKPEFQNLKYE